MLEFDKQLCKRLFFTIPGLSDSKLGGRLGLKRQTIQGWRAGKSRPTLLHMYRISQLTRISIRWYVTGQTTDSVSLSYAYYPLYYHGTKILSLKAYTFARKAAAQLLQTSNDRFFLPMLSALNCQAFSDYTKPENSPAIQLPETFDELKNSFTPEDYLVDKNTQLLYTEMINSFCESMCFESNSLSYTDRVAYTSIEQYIASTHASQTAHGIGSMQSGDCVTVCGDSIAPVVRDNQRVVVQGGVDPSMLTIDKPVLAIIEVCNSLIPESKQESAPDRIKLCRYISSTDNKLILSDLTQTSAPIISDYDKIYRVFPIHSVIID